MPDRAHDVQPRLREHIHAVAVAIMDALRAGALAGKRFRFGLLAPAKSFNVSYGDILWCGASVIVCGGLERDFALFVAGGTLAHAAILWQTDAAATLA